MKGKKLGILVLFFILCFGALGIGSLLMGGGPTGEWYRNLNRAPWEPPGWVFGATWSFIMLCFSIFMWLLYRATAGSERSTIITVFITQWILNVSWNPTFFRWHNVASALLLIITLNVVVGWFMVKGFKRLGWAGLLVLPYFIWLAIATSLNGYVLLHN